MHQHLGSLIFSTNQGLLCLLLLGCHDASFLIQPSKLVVHALDGQEFLLEQRFGVDEEGLGLPDHPGDLLTGSLGLHLDLDLLVDLGIDLLFQLHILKLMISQVLINVGLSLVSGELVLQSYIGVVIHLQHVGVVLIV